MKVWEDYSIRQIDGFYRIYGQKKIEKFKEKQEELRWHAACHGVKLDDHQEGLSSEDNGCFDLNKCKTVEEYNECVRKIREARDKAK